MNVNTDIIKRNNVRIVGSGTKVLLFAHGFGCDQNIWNDTVAALKGDYRIVLFDYVGAGNSDKESFSKARYSELQGYAQDVLDIIQALDLQEVTLIGHSVSGAVSYLVSLEASERVKQIIAISPSSCYVNDESSNYYGGFDESDIQELFAMMEHNFYEWAGFLAPRAMDQPERPDLGEVLASSFRASDPVILRSFARATFLCDVRALLPSVHTPVHLIYGSADMVVPDSAIEYQINHLPNCTATKMDFRGHYPHVSAPHEIAVEIEKHLR
ncbi:alpha/beta hydrolase [Aliidiomarina shirensis]|uniref:Alpha/beta hydrolase n=1 Tax=Aliidiomarina shirensis TaxID=1048642 RepID=A0A432WXI3_9GAMM|nr:alpha/beta hydrolase [Aliidiomarina shirensis]RUO38492.1 alpha/beta hydrolase [Aliidiomarina shirensis]